MTGAAWLIVAGCAVVTFAIKATGPVALGGRDLPGAFSRVIVLMAPALLAALIVTNALADGNRVAIGADTIGVAAGALIVWRWGSIVGCVVTAAVVTAALRAAGV